MQKLQKIEPPTSYARQMFEAITAACNLPESPTREKLLIQLVAVIEVLCHSPLIMEFSDAHTDE